MSPEMLQQETSGHAGPPRNQRLGPSRIIDL